MAAETVLFKRNQFSTRLPTGYTYSLSHSWLARTDTGHWRVGLTKFATRMLGEIVELDFELSAPDPFEVGQVLGWIEGFKATSDIYAPARGKFLGVNPAAVADTAIICKDPYYRGWLYEFEGEPDDDVVDVKGYMEHLTATIDRMLEKPWKSSQLGPGEA